MLSKQAQVSKKQIGLLAEQAACRYLQSQGLRLINRNFQCFHGEIDLIMDDKQQIVFVEVRHRGRRDYGTALESVDQYKMRKLVKTATLYLQKHKLLYKVSSRFDVVSMHGTLAKPEIEWIKNAFTVDY